MGVIVRDRHAVYLAQKLEPAPRAPERREAARAIGGRNALHHRARIRRQRVVYVVPSRYGKLNMRCRLARCLRVETVEARAVFPHVPRAVIGGRVDGKGAHGERLFLGNTRHRFYCVRVVGVEQNGVCREQREFSERGFQVIHRAEKLQMVVVDIQDHREVRREVQERVVEFARLHHDLLPLAVTPICVDQRQLAADHRRGVCARHEHDLCCHCRCGRFAVRARDAHRMRVQACRIPQHHTALHRWDAQPRGLYQFGVIVRDGGGIDHQIGIPHVFSVLGHLHMDAHCPLPADNIALVHVGACDGIALRVQYLYQRKHAAAANAHKMDMVFSLEQRLIRFVHMLHLLLTVYRISAKK